MPTLNCGGFGWAEEAGAIDDAFCAGFQEDASVFGGFQAASDLAGEALADHFDEAAIVALAHRGIEVDELNDGVSGEAFNPVFEVVEGELQLFSLDELDDAAAHEID